jgi:hypothetical protein
MRQLNWYSVILITVLAGLICSSSKKPFQNVNDNSVIINIVGINKGKLDLDSDINIEFEIINQTNKDIIFPKPVKLIDYSTMLEPEFFNVKVIAYDCQGLLLALDGFKKEADFAIIKANSKELFSLNPFENRGLECEKIEGEKQFVIIEYHPDPDKLTTEYATKNIKSVHPEFAGNVFGNILRDTLVSKPFEIGN